MNPFAALATAAILSMGAFLITGCGAHTQVRTVDVMVPVPVPCPAPPATTRPALALADLTPDSPPAEVMRAYTASVEQCMGYAAELEHALDAYNPPPP